VLGPSLPDNRCPYFSLLEPCYDYAIFDVEMQSVFRVGMPLSIRYCRATAACAPSYDLVAPPTLHPAAPTLCSCGGLCFVRCVAPPAVRIQLALSLISYASSPPRRHIPAASLHHGRGVCFDGYCPQPHHPRGVPLPLCKHDWHSFGDRYRPLLVHRLLRRRGVIVFLFEGPCGITHLRLHLRLFHVGGLSGGYFGNVASDAVGLLTIRA
jgi:hypothetical protein